MFPRRKETRAITVPLPKNYTENKASNIPISDLLRGQIKQGLHSSLCSKIFFRGHFDVETSKSQRFLIMEDEFPKQ